MENKILQDLKERFLKYPAIRGILMVIGGIMLLLLPHNLQTIIAIGFIIEGLYQLLHNPVIRDLKLWSMISNKDINNLFNFNKPITPPASVSDNAIPNPDTK